MTIFNYLLRAPKRLSSVKKLVKIRANSNIPAQKMKYLSQDEAIKLDEDLFSEYAFSVDQLMELAGLSVATAIAKTYPKQNHNKPIICCGPGNNGGDGFVCARHLKLFGYSPIVICIKPGKSQLYKNLMEQCRKFEIDVLDDVPKEPFNQLGNLMVDAIFGFSFKPPNRSESFAKLLNSMKNASHQIPLVSVDIPSGWHVENGDSNIDLDQAKVDSTMRIPKLEPDCLISLTAPKQCARYFKGRFHYLGGRFCPKSLQEKYNLNLPEYPATDCFMLMPAAS